MAPQRDNRAKVSALLREVAQRGHKVSEVANLVGVSRTTVYSIKKHMDDGEGINRRAGSGQKTVVDRDSLRDAIRSSPFSERLEVSIIVWFYTQNNKTYFFKKRLFMLIATNMIHIEYCGLLEAPLNNELFISS